jgi:hypothetical protein
MRTSIERLPEDGRLARRNQITSWTESVCYQDLIGRRSATVQSMPSVRGSHSDISGT